MSELNKSKILGKYIWIERDGFYATIGLNEYLIRDFKEVYGVELPEVGEAIKTDDHFLCVETAEGLVAIYAPISGQVVEINNEILDDIDLINCDPYGAGWLVLIEVDEFEGNGFFYMKT
ncbi:MAG: glycine cleavage system protein H [Halanaerobiales bacterium]|nr:glycine cleavage system protein H [Halanaerobiales bacterium]